MFACAMASDEDAHDALRETPLGTLKSPKIATEMNLVTIPGTDPIRVEGVYDAPRGPFAYKY